MRCRIGSESPFWPRRSTKGGGGGRKHNKNSYRGELREGKVKSKDSGACTERCRSW